MAKTVRVTLELGPGFFRHLHTNQQLEKTMRPDKQMTASQLVARLVYMEGRGAPEAQIDTETPIEWWEDGPKLIHDERRVYEEGKQIAGPSLIPDNQEMGVKDFLVSEIRRFRKEYSNAQDQQGAGPLCLAKKAETLTNAVGHLDAYQCVHKLLFGDVFPQDDA